MKSLLVLLLLAGICAAAPVNIMFGLLAVTYVPMPAPRNPQLTLKPLAALADNKQQWEIINGFIHSTVPGFTDRVFDITGNSVNEGAAVILYPKNGATNQQWTATQCAGVMEPAKDYYQSCLDDVIATGDYRFAATAINNYAAKCSKYSPAGTITLPTSGADSTAVGAGLAAEVPIGAGVVSFDITARNVDGQVVTAGGDVFTTSATGPASVSFSSPNSLGNGVYRVSYTPLVIGNYVISVRYRGVDQIQNSPFSVSFVSNAANPALTTVAGNGLGPMVSSGTDLGVQVTVYTAAGIRKTTGGDAVTFDVSGAFVSKGEVVDNGDGTYDFTYQKNWLEVFQLTIKLNGVDIPGSPFSIECSDDFKK